MIRCQLSKTRQKTRKRLTSKKYGRDRHSQRADDLEIDCGLELAQVMLILLPQLHGHQCNLPKSRRRTLEEEKERRKEKGAGRAALHSVKMHDSARSVQCEHGGMTVAIK
jgi:hypothetical protein